MKTAHIAILAVAIAQAAFAQTRPAPDEPVAPPPPPGDVLINPVGPGGPGGPGGFAPPDFGGRGGRGGFGGGGPGGPGRGGINFVDPLAQAKTAITATDEEWKVIGPKLRRVVRARQDADTALGQTQQQNNFFGGGGGPGFDRGDPFAGPGGEGMGGPGGAGRGGGFERRIRPEPVAQTQPSTSTAPSTAPTTQPQNVFVPRGGGGGGGAGGGFGQQGAVATALSELQTLLADAKVEAKTLMQKIESVRALRQKARDELKLAQEDLLLLLTPDQEAALVSLGYLD